VTSDRSYSHKEPCPECGSSDALAVYKDGGRHCYSAGCGYHVKGTGEYVEVEEVTTNVNRPVDMFGVIASIPDRKLSQDTCKKYQVTVTYDSKGKIEKHHYPYYNTETGELTGSKVRTVATKGFVATGDIRNTGLFGQQQCRGRGKFITITEGELDAMRAFRTAPVPRPR
jgi:twinkle protein